MTRCTRCILTDVYPDITFDKTGVCSRCVSWEKEYGAIDYISRRQKLDALIDDKKRQARDKNCPYDVVVPVSGGKDSAYVLYVMTKIYNCNVLAVNYNNLFQTELAWYNIQNLIDTFDVELQIVGLKPSLLKNAYGKAIQYFNDFCLVCNCTGYWILLDFLSRRFFRYEYQPLVIGGWSKAFEYDPYINSLDIGRYIHLLEKTGLIKKISAFLDIKMLEVLSQSRDVRDNHSLNYIQLPDYMPWEHTQILHILQKHGWKRKKKRDTHFDCWASPIADWLEQKKWGLNQITTTRAAQVRAGLLSREQALGMEEKSPGPDQQLLEKFCDFLSVPRLFIKD